MSAVFIKVLNMSVAACWIILAALIARPLLRRAPKQFFCLLWGLAAIRLILPFSLQSPLSLVPNAETVPQEITVSEEARITTGISVINSLTDKQLPAAVDTESGSAGATGGQQGFSPAVSGTAAVLSRRERILNIASLVWLTGGAAMLIAGFVSYLRLRRRVSASLKAEGYYICDEIKSPFILGIFRPRIYVPSSLSEEELNIVLAHERAHLMRRDHITKPLGYGVLALHWMNPLVWVAYALFCRDTESACDERVIRSMDRSRRAEYSETLMRLACPKSGVAACPVAFGEVSVENRVKSVLSYKKPAFWAILLGALLIIAAGIFLLTDPVKKAEARCYRILSDGKELRLGLTEEGEKRLASILGGARFKAGAAAGFDYRMELGSRELWYDSVSGTLYNKNEGKTAHLSEKTRGELKSLLGLGAVTRTVNPEGSGYRIEPLLVKTDSEEPFIELEISVSRSEEVPYYCTLYRIENGEPGEFVTIPDNPGRFYYIDRSIDKTLCTSFALPLDFVSVPGEYCLCMYQNVFEDVEGGTSTVHTEFSDRRVYFTSGLKTEALSLYRDARVLTDRYPALDLDAKNGVNAYVIAYSSNSFVCTLTPGGEQLDAFALSMLEYEQGIPRLSMEEARVMVKHYGVGRGNLNVIVTIDALSSSISFFNESRPDPEQIKSYLLGETDELIKTIPVEPEEGKPRAFSLLNNISVTAAAWDLGSGAEYASEAFKGIKLDKAPCIAVIWENTGGSSFGFGEVLSLEYLPEGDSARRIESEWGFALIQNLLEPGGSVTKLYNLGGFRFENSGRYRLWLSVNANGTESIDSYFWIEFTITEQELNKLK